MNRLYLDTARLLTQVAPAVFVDDRLALKGGTAINLFIRDMPRLSVDLDLVFTDHTFERDNALARINAAVNEAARRLHAQGLEVHVPGAGGDGETRLLVRRARSEVKVEINTVIRGTKGLRLPFAARSSSTSPATTDPSTRFCSQNRATFDWTTNRTSWG